MSKEQANTLPASDDADMVVAQTDTALAASVNANMVVAQTDTALAAPIEDMLDMFSKVAEAEIVIQTLEARIRTKKQDNAQAKISGFEGEKAHIALQERLIEQFEAKIQTLKQLARQARIYTAVNAEQFWVDAGAADTPHGNKEIVNELSEALMMYHPKVVQMVHKWTESGDGAPDLSEQAVLLENELNQVLEKIKRVEKPITDMKKNLKELIKAHAGHAAASAGAAASAAASMAADGSPSTSAQGADRAKKRESDEGPGLSQPPSKMPKATIQRKDFELFFRQSCKLDGYITRTTVAAADGKEFLQFKVLKSYKDVLDARWFPNEGRFWQSKLNTSFLRDEKGPVWFEEDCSFTLRDCRTSTEEPEPPSSD